MNALLNTLRLAAPTLAALALATPAQAVITEYTDLASFMAAVQNPGTDSFDDLPAFALVDTPALRTAGDFSYSVDALTGLFGLNDGVDGLLSTNDRLDPLSFTGFSAGVSAIGLNAFGTNFDGLAVSGAVLNVTVVDSLGGTLTLDTTDATPGSFFGFVSSGAIASLVVQLSAPDEAYATANNLVLASVVPEPGTCALMLGGLGMVGWLARRRRGAD